MTYGRLIKPRKHGQPKLGLPSWALTIPAEMARAIPDIEQTLFVAELVPEGILYRAAGRQVIEPPKDWPASSGNDKKVA